MRSLTSILKAAISLTYPVEPKRENPTALARDFGKKHKRHEPLIMVSTPVKKYLPAPEEMLSVMSGTACEIAFSARRYCGFRDRKELSDGRRANSVFPQPVKIRGFGPPKNAIEIL